MRTSPDIRIRIEHVPSGDVIRLGLHRHPTSSRRVLVDRDRRRSERCRDATLTEVFDLLREWTVGRLQ